MEMAVNALLRCPVSSNDQLLKTGPAVNHGLAQIFGAGLPVLPQSSVPRFLISKLR
jgi:hypothetical protein